MDKEYGDIDSWISDDDEDYCYSCEDWADDDGHGNCKVCGVSFKSVDPFISKTTALTHSSEAPKVNTYTGDMWDRSGAYTWGGGTSWWNRGINAVGGAMTSMWGGSWSTTTTTDAGRMLKHKRHLDSLCKVVDPTVNHHLNFAYEKGKNYSNIKTGKIVIDGTLIENNDDKLDVCAGLSIHEKLHLIHTSPIKSWESQYAYDNNLDTAQQKLLHNVVNMIEDEYIEKQLAKDCAGFVSYIDATKEHFFADNKAISVTHNDEFLDVMNTLLAFIRYPVSIDIDRRKRHAKHITYFSKALKNGLDSRENTYACFDSIYQYMNELSNLLAPDDAGKDRLENAMKEIEDRLGDVLSDSEMDKVREQMAKDIAEEFKKRGTPLQQAMFDNDDHVKAIEALTDYGMDTDKLDDKLAEAIRELEDSDYHETKIDKGKALHPRQTKVTWRMAMPNEYERDKYKNEMRSMRSTINSLKKKINLYGNTQKYTIRNQKRGKLDKRVLHRIPMGARELFKMDFSREDKPLDICLLVDESGSMHSGLRMHMARKSAIAIKEALSDNPKLNLWVYGHTADGHDDWHSDKGSTNMTQYWGPTMKDRPMAMGAMTARYENRDGNAIWAVADKVSTESDQPMSNKLLIVLSDGQPAAYNYGGMSGRQHVKGVVKELEGKGWSVIQVGFGGIGNDTMSEMFTNYMKVDSTTELPNKLSKIMKRVMKL